METIPQLSCVTSERTFQDFLGRCLDELTEKEHASLYLDLMEFVRERPTRPRWIPFRNSFFSDVKASAGVYFFCHRLFLRRLG